MGARELLAELTGAGLTVAVDGDRLVIRPASLLTDDMRNSLRTAKPELLALLTSVHDFAGGALHDDPAPEAPPHPLRHAWLARMAMLGMDEGRALSLADRLERRDMGGDDRRACIECSHLGNGGRCLAAATGRLRNADKRHEPVLDLLQRCEAFGLRKGMECRA